MFQYSALRGLAEKSGLHWRIPEPSGPKLDNYGLFEAFEMANVEPHNVSQQTPNRTVKEKYFHYDDALSDYLQDGDDLFGYFQSEKYFENVKQAVRQDFTIRGIWQEQAEKFFVKHKLQEPIFLHVRRGDAKITGRRGEKWSYQKLQKFHPLCKSDYYRRALAEFEQDRQVVIVSDSITWCKSQEIFQGPRFTFSENSKTILEDGASSPYVDLAIMKLCSGAIIANSSLSWWGAWLISDNKKDVVAPTPWFGVKYKGNWTGDLIPVHWKEIYNNPVKETKF